MMFLISGYCIKELHELVRGWQSYYFDPSNQLQFKKSFVNFQLALQYYLSDLIAYYHLQLSYGGFSIHRVTEIIDKYIEQNWTLDGSLWYIRNNHVMNPPFNGADLDHNSFSYRDATIWNNLQKTALSP